MRKTVLFLFFLILNGCSFTNFFVQGEVDKVTVVKYAPYMKHHRAYFTRTHLKTIRGGKKYLYLYNAKTNDVGVLLHRNNQYVLYNMSDPKKKPLATRVNAKQKYWQVLRTFRRHGFKLIPSLASVGYTASVSHRRYKGIKTLLIETKEYSKLQSLYKNAIKTYDAKKIQRIKTKLPKVLISSYYSQYKQRAKTRAQLLQLKVIANKLGLDAPKIPQLKSKKTVSSTSVNKPQSIKKTPVAAEVKKTKEEVLPKPEETLQKETVKKSPPQPQSSTKPYRYYLKVASLNELSNYISDNATKNALSYSQYNRLKRRKANLQEEKLMQEGSLEELIAAYKVNKKAKYKRRIMSLMKDKQKEN